jgi:Arc/MetJ-type ribon-helix-helix transcriptional regulator
MTITNPDVARLIAEQLNTGRYTSADEVLLAGLKLLQEREYSKAENGVHAAPTDDSDDLAAIFAAIAKDVPDSEWEKFPADFSQNIDHYLYGAPKRD